MANINKSSHSMLAFFLFSLVLASIYIVQAKRCRNRRQHKDAGLAKVKADCVIKPIKQPTDLITLVNTTRINLTEKNKYGGEGVVAYEIERIIYDEDVYIRYDRPKSVTIEMEAKREGWSNLPVSATMSLVEEKKNSIGIPVMWSHDGHLSQVRLLKTSVKLVDEYYCHVRFDTAPAIRPYDACYAICAE